MSKNITTATVLFDGQVLRPDTPLDLEPNTHYVVTIWAEEDTIGGNAWELLAQSAGTIDAPADWSSEHDHYLYGTAKRQSSHTSDQA